MQGSRGTLARLRRSLPRLREVIPTRRNHIVVAIRAALLVAPGVSGGQTVAWLQSCHDGDTCTFGGVRDTADVSRWLKRRGLAVDYSGETCPMPGSGGRAGGPPPSR